MTQSLSPKTSQGCNLLIMTTIFLFSHLLFLGSTTLVISLKLEIKFFAFASIFEGAWVIKLDARFVPIDMCQEKGFQGTCDEYSSSFSNWEFLLFVAFLELELTSFIHGVFEKPGIHKDVQVLPWQIYRWDQCISSFYPMTTLLFYHHPQSLQHLGGKASKVKLCILSQL